VLPYSAVLGQNLKTGAMDKSENVIYSIGASTTVILKGGKTLPQYVAAIIGKFLKYYNISKLRSLLYMTSIPITFELDHSTARSHTA